MKFRNLNFIFVCTMLLVLNACNKETSTPVSNENDMALEIKEYYPPEEVDVTEKVVGFLDYTKAYNPNASFKTNIEFNDMEVNEAMWTLEAASNFLVNENLKYQPDIENKELEYNIEFKITDRNKLIGNEMTSKFSKLIEKIGQDAKQKGKLPNLIDWEFMKLTETEAKFKLTISFSNNKLLTNNRIPQSQYDYDCIEDNCGKYIISCDAATNFPGVLDTDHYTITGHLTGLIVTEIHNRKTPPPGHFFHSIKWLSENWDCSLGNDDEDDCSEQTVYTGSADWGDIPDDLQTSTYNEMAEKSINEIYDHFCTAPWHYHTQVANTKLLQIFFGSQHSASNEPTTASNLYATLYKIKIGKISYCPTWGCY